MDLEQLLNSFDPSNAKQIEAVQKALRARGLYDEPPDGRMGKKTAAAIRNARAAIQREKDRALQGQQLQQQQRELEQRAAERSWQNQLAQAAKYTAVPAGLYAGHRMAKGIEARQLATEAAQRGRMLPNAPKGWGSSRRFAGRFAPYALRGSLLAGEGMALREGVAPQLSNETARETARIAGSGLVGAGVGVTGEGIVKSFTPQVQGGGVAPAAGAGETLPTSTIEAAPTKAAPVEATSRAARPYSERLIKAARAAGATGRLTKKSAAAYLGKTDFANVKPNVRAAVARELGVAPGRNVAARLSDAVKKMAKSRGAGSLFWPIVAAGVAGEAAYSDAEARSLGEGERQRNALAAAGAGGGLAAGIAYGASKAAPMIERAIGPAAGAMLPGLGAASMPSVIEGMTTPTPNELETARRWAARNLPEWMQNQYIREAGAREAAQGEAGMSGDEFDQALREFLSEAQGHQDGAALP